MFLPLRLLTPNIIPPHLTIPPAPIHFDFTMKIEQVGNYNPMIEDSYAIDLEKVDKWIGDGAKPSSTVNSLIKKARKSAASE